MTRPPPRLARAYPIAAGLLLLALSACGGGRYGAWNGQRGYDGHGDYGYDPAQSRLEARDYLARAAHDYPAPGPPDDPWGPYITEAATRFGVPDRWIRPVMRQESGGRLYGPDGSLVTSDAGAMGLMQIMPATYETLRQRYGLGDDPYQPHDNIMAGAAYIREMYDRYGAPGFLAAYNAGPDRLDAYLAGGTPLPDETVGYLASVSPQLGDGVAMSGPLATYATPSSADRAYAGGGMSGAEYYAQGAAAAAGAPAPAVVGATDVADQAYAGGGMSGSDYAARAPVADSAPPAADQAYEGGGEVADTSPAPVATAPLPAPATATATAAPQPARAPAPAVALAPVAAPGSIPSGWGVQVGAFASPAVSRAAIASARARARIDLAAAHDMIVPVWHGTLLYRARLTGLSADAATAVCSALVRDGMACLTVPPGL